MKAPKEDVGELSITVIVVEIDTPSFVVITETVGGKVAEVGRSPAEDNTVVGDKPLLDEITTMDPDSASFPVSIETVGEAVTSPGEVENLDWLDKYVLYVKVTLRSIDEPIADEWSLLSLGPSTKEEPVGNIVVDRVAAIVPSGSVAVIDDEMRSNAVSLIVSLLEKIMSDSVFEMVLEENLPEAEVRATFVSPLDTEERSSDNL